MIIYVDQSGLKDLQEVLAAEGVTSQDRPTGSVREVNTGSWPVIEVQVNLPEVKVPRGISAPGLFVFLRVN